MTLHKVNMLAVCIFWQREQNSGWYSPSLSRRLMNFLLFSGPDSVYDIGHTLVQQLSSPLLARSCDQQVKHNDAKLLMKKMNDLIF